MKDGGVKAAFGKVKITPEELAPLQGYDPSLYIANPDKDILDELYARVLILDDGRSRQVIVSVDCCLTNEKDYLSPNPDGQMEPYRQLLQTFPEGTKRLWADAAQTEEFTVSVHATHTHSAPEHFSEKYTSRIAAMIAETAERLQDVQIRAAAGQCSVSVNRRPHLQHNDTLPIDHSLHLIMIESLDGEALGAIVNCAVHPTLLANPFNRVSSEFVGLAMSEYESTFKEGFVSLFIQGFSGNVGPRDHYRTETEDTYRWVLEMAQALHRDIAHAAKDLQPIGILPMKAAEKQVTLPTRQGYFMPTIDVTLQGFRIGDLLLLAVSCEVFNGYERLIKPYSPASFTLMSGLANGCHGYLPTVEAFRDGLGGYEMNVTPYDETVSNLFVRAAAELVESL
ncbi:hypothetical protein [Paenibacillus agaridevorans]|uniref:hypothetical protein n=1 Tax=Paenibacillus agaridevorans TaxID=171404 RepID=UPI001BE491F1|nr:hypothetical protein [Paenibacillus agaridevorans]